LYNALSTAETGSYPSPWIRTVGKNSTAYGPAQVTHTLIQDMMTRRPKLFAGNEEYTKKFIEQGEKMKTQYMDSEMKTQYMDSEDPVYGRGGSGVLGGEEYHEGYKRMCNSLFCGLRADLEQNKKLKQGELNVDVLTQRWRGKTRKEDPRYYREVDRIMNQKDKTPAPTPAPSAPAPTAPAPQADQGFDEYEVKSGDTLSAIAKRTGRSVEQISKENKIADPNKIGVGQRIRIPQG
jgi:LysM repeat protein